MSSAKLAIPRQHSWAYWKGHLIRLLLTIVLLIFTSMVIIPFVWMILMSVRTTGEILNDPYGLPTHFRWENYYNLMFDPQISFYRFFYNSVFVTVLSVIGTTLLVTMAGFGFGRPRYHFKFRGALFALLIAAILLPPQISYIPQFVMMSRYGLLNSKWSLVLLYTAGGLAVGTYLMRTYFSQLPQELEDAARIDGCNDWQLFWRIMLPIAKPAVATIVLLNFMGAWNELLLAITMVTNPAERTLPSAIFNFVGENRADFAMAAASLVTAMLPVLIIYLFLSERFIEGMTAGAIKA